MNGVQIVTAYVPLSKAKGLKDSCSKSVGTIPGISTYARMFGYSRSSSSAILTGESLLSMYPVMLGNGSVTPVVNVMNVAGKSGVLNLMSPRASKYGPRVLMV